MNTRLSLYLGALLTLLLALPLTASAQTVYHIVPKESTVTYSMDHPAHKWDGVSHSATGTVEIGPDGTVTAIHVEIPVLTFDSGNRNRDSHMAESVEFYLFPKVIFDATGVTPVDSVATDGQADAFWRIRGNLTFHGVTKPIETVAKIVKDGNRLRAEGAFDVKITDFDIERPSLLMVKVKDWIGLAFDVTAVAGDTAAAASTHR
ncbi:YceI family protein [Rhodocaloribacter sp.]